MFGASGNTAASPPTKKWTTIQLDNTENAPIGWSQWVKTMVDEPTKRGKLIALLENALAAAEELADGATAYLSERALDEARAQPFRLVAKSSEG